jgi:hypothetical protein
MYTVVFSLQVMLIKKKRSRESVFMIKGWIVEKG